MAKFDLEKHKAGRKASTKDGNIAEWVCSLHNHHNPRPDYKEVFRITYPNGSQVMDLYNEKGEHCVLSYLNLELEPEKVTLYVNVYQCPDNTFYVSTHYLSLVSATEGVSSSKDCRYIKTVPIEIEI